MVMLADERVVFGTRTLNQHGTAAVSLTTRPPCTDSQTRTNDLTEGLSYLFVPSGRILEFVKDLSGSLVGARSVDTKFESNFKNLWGIQGEYRI